VAALKILLLGSPFVDRVNRQEDIDLDEVDVVHEEKQDVL